MSAALLCAPALLLMNPSSPQGIEGVVVSTLYTDSSTGLSHFRTDTVNWEFDPSGPNPSADVTRMTELLPATHLGFVSIPAGRPSDWHTAPRKQYAIALGGKAEVVAGSGERRVFSPGSVILLLDVDGQGHQTNVLGEEDFFFVWIPVP